MTEAVCGRDIVTETVWGEGGTDTVTGTVTNVTGIEQQQGLETVSNRRYHRREFTGRAGRFVDQFEFDSDK